MKITDPYVLELAAADETPYEGFVEGQVIFQRPCPDCDHGMLWAPARFHAACGGSGFLTRAIDIQRKEQP